MTVRIRNFIPSVSARTSSYEAEREYPDDVDQRLYWLHRPEEIDEEAGEGIAEETIGPLRESQIINLFRRKDCGGFTGDCFYRREGEDQWRLLRTFCHAEFGDPDLIAKFKQARVTHVRWLATGLPNECQACKALDGKLFSIDDPPPIPPPDCRCELWCGCLLGAARA